MKYTEIFPPRQAIPSRIAHRFATQYATYDNQEEQSLHTPPEARNSKLSDVNNHKFWSHSSIIYPPRKPCNPAPRGASSPLPACLKYRVLCALLTAGSCTNSPFEIGTPVLYRSRGSREFSVQILVLLCFLFSFRAIKCFMSRGPNRIITLFWYYVPPHQMIRRKSECTVPCDCLFSPLACWPI